MIYIRPCGHSDNDTRRTKYPERCPACFELAKGETKEVVES